MRINTLEQARLAVVPFVHEMTIKNVCPFAFESDTHFYIPPWDHLYWSEAEGAPAFLITKETGLIEKVSFFGEVGDRVDEMIMDPATVEVGDLSKDLDREARNQAIAEQRQLAAQA